MGFSRINSASINGIEADIVTVETHVDFQGFPLFHIVGLPAKEIEESKDRIRSAIKNSKYKFPDARITVNLAPADIAKKGSLYDLPIAIGILSAAGNFGKYYDFSDYVLFGELSLNGELNSIKGVLNILDLCRSKNKKAIINSKENIPNWVECDLYEVNSLKEFIESYLYKKEFKIFNRDSKKDGITPVVTEGDYLNVEGQYIAKRAIMIAVAGRHHIALSGPPGAGKTMMLKLLETITPDLNDQDKRIVNKIHQNHDSNNWPFRSPHHSISRAAMLGGGNPIAPGEVTYAHKGVLFLDEFAEFDKDIIESLRQPMEDKKIDIKRVNGASTYPCDFMLAVTYNLCPCGFLGHPKVKCKCTSIEIKNYSRKISGPILDRIDIHINCSPQEKSSQLPNIENYSSKKMKQKIQNAIKNSNKNIKVHSEANLLIDEIKRSHVLTYRGITKVIKVAKTIALIEDATQITKSHILEAFQYRKVS